MSFPAPARIGVFPVIIVIFCAILIAAAWMAIPTFEGLYSEFDSALPGATRALFLAGPPGATILILLMGAVSLWLHTVWRDWRSIAFFILLYLITTALYLFVLFLPMFMPQGGLSG